MFNKNKDTSIMVSLLTFIDNLNLQKLRRLECFTLISPKRRNPHRQGRSDDTLCSRYSAYSICNDKNHRHDQCIVYCTSILIDKSKGNIAELEYKLDPKAIPLHLSPQTQGTQDSCQQKCNPREGMLRYYVIIIIASLEYIWKVITAADSAGCKGRTFVNYWQNIYFPR